MSGSPTIATLLLFGFTFVRLWALWVFGIRFLVSVLFFLSSAGGITALFLSPDNLLGLVFDVLFLALTLYSLWGAGYCAWYGKRFFDWLERTSGVPDFIISGYSGVLAVFLVANFILPIFFPVNFGGTMLLGILVLFDGFLLRRITRQF